MTSTLRAWASAKTAFRSARSSLAPEAVSFQTPTILQPAFLAKTRRSRSWRAQCRSDQRSIPGNKVLRTVPIEPIAPNTPEKGIFPWHSVGLFKVYFHWDSQDKHSRWRSVNVRHTSVS
jgi:hypothetical protein